MIIRKAVPEDLRSIAELYVKNHKAAYRGLLSDDYLDGLTTEYALDKWGKFRISTDSELITAYEGDVFLGFAAGIPDSELEETWYLESLHVSDKAREKGVGTALIKAIAGEGYNRGFLKMSVCIVRGNDRAGDLYRKLGAEHCSYFEDDFRGTVSHSEKLIWNKLPLE